MRKRWFASVLLGVLLFIMGMAYADVPTVEEYLEYADMEFMPLVTLRNEAGFTPIACTPDAFNQAIKASIGSGDMNNAGSRFRQALTGIGISMNESAEIFFSGYPGWTKVEEYGVVRGIEGEQHLTTVTLAMGGYRIIAVFLEGDSGWMLTDFLNVDDYGVDSGSPLPLLTRDDGSPGAWLQVQAIGHGTGVYMLIEEWYNVFTRERDVGFTQEGWDQIGADDDYVYCYALWMEIDVDGQTIPAQLSFTKWTSFLRSNFHTNAEDEQLAAHTITGTYGYDAATASYSLLSKTVLEDASPRSPAMDFWIRGIQ